MKKILLLLLFTVLISVYSSAQIAVAEYFFDTDPGVGNGTPVTLIPGDSVNVTKAIPVASLSPGFHYIAVRTKDANGQWGLLESRGFYVMETPGITPDIVAAEYYYDNDPGVGNARAIAIPSPISSLTDSLTLPLDTLGLGSYQIAVRVKNSAGVWGLFENRPFRVCTTYGAVSGMNFLVNGNQVFFTNTSVYNDTTRWEFGDNTFDTVLNPIKTYTTAGNYTVRLISANGCAKDTLTTLLSITGIQSINANKGGNAGVVTVIFEGNGFTAGSVLKLQKGATILLPTEKKFINSNRILGYFNLNGADTGRYNVIADLGGGPLDTLKNGFYVQEAKFVNLSLEDGFQRNPARFNAMSRSFTIQNQGNEDAIMPAFVTGLGIPGGGAVLNMMSNEKFVNLASEGIFQNTYQYLTANGITGNVMEAADTDSSRKKQILAFYKVKIPAESYATTGFTVSNSSLIPSYKNGYMVRPPLYKSGIVISDTESSDARDCMNSFLKKAVRKNLVVTLSDAGWNSCFNSAFDTLTKSIRNIVRNIDLQNQSVPMKAMFSSLLVQMAQCGSTGLPAVLSSNQFEKIIKDVTYNWLFLENLDSIGRPCFDTTDNIVFRNKTSIPSRENRTVTKVQRTTADCDGGGAGQFPELAEICSDFAKPCEKVAELIFEDNCDLCKKAFVKLVKALTKGPGGGVGGGFCGGMNSGSAGCKTLCEVSSVDPNIKTGPGNNADTKYVNVLSDYLYTISFENLATATAPAAYVEIKDTLDKTRLDLSSFQTGNLGWGDSLVVLDANEGNYSLLKDLRPSRPNKLRVDVRIDTATGIVTWKFFTLNLVSLQLTDDPAEGFLPPNIDGKIGQGFVRFSVKPKAGVTSGAIINNKATIIFDDNAPINTGEWQHIVDTTKPTSQVASLVANVPTKDFVVNWGGSDAHSGVSNYLVYVSVNDSLFTKWKNGTTAVSDTYQGEFGKTYKFFSIALDKAGNYEDFPADPYRTPDAVTSPLATDQVVSIQNGLWHQPGTWSNNLVPTDATKVIVKHQVTVDADAVCKSLNAIAPGLLQINSGKRLDIKGN